MDALQNKGDLHSQVQHCCYFLERPMYCSACEFPLETITNVNSLKHETQKLNSTSTLYQSTEPLSHMTIHQMQTNLSIFSH